MAQNWCITKGVVCDRVAASGYCAQTVCTRVFQNEQQMQRTNADRIRSMSDEELAKFLEYEGGGACAEVCGWLDWLRKPAEED